MNCTRIAHRAMLLAMLLPSACGGSSEMGGAGGAADGLHTGGTGGGAGSERERTDALLLPTTVDARAAGPDATVVKDAAAEDGKATSTACASATRPAQGLAVRFVADDLAAGPVASWPAAVGGVAANQGTSDRRPVVAKNILAGHSVVHFDGDNDFLTFPHEVTGKSALTIALVSRTWQYQRASENRDCDFNKDGLTDVGRELNCSGTDQLVLAWNEGNGAFASTGIFLGVGQTEATFRFGTGKPYRRYKTPFVLATPLKDQFVVVVAEVDGRNRTMWINGKIPQGATNYRDTKLEPLSTRSDQDESEALHSDWPQAIQSTEGQAWIGRGRFDATTGHWAGELAEVLIYDASLNEADRQQLEAALGCHYGIAAFPIYRSIGQP